ncbi:MAG: TIGR00730 family Rossman fold protein [Bradymonadaceae bacterium]
MNTICVFCGSSPGNDPAYIAGAKAMGAAMASRSLKLVYGGSGIGMMGAIANAVLEGGEEVIGVIPKALATKERAHQGITEIHVVSSMHERKAMMADLAGAFVAMPGGMGTLEELCEIITWAQLGIHTKPIGLLNLRGYFDGFKAFLGHMVDQGFLASYHRDLVVIRSEPDELIEALKDYRHSGGGIWMDATES